MRKIFLGIIICISSILYAQVGINKITPSSTLAVNGSFEAAYKEVTATSYTFTATDHYVSYSGTANATFTLPVIGTGSTNFHGRFYKVKNLSNSTITVRAAGSDVLRLGTSTSATFPVPPGSFIEVVNNTNAAGGTWDLSFLGFTSLTNNTEVYGTQLRIPPHASATGGLAVADWTNHANASFDTGTGSDIWWIISKTSTAYSFSSNYIRPSKMVLVYEYQGTPFNTTNLYPILTSGNSSSYPDIFTPDFISLVNNGTGGRTRLTVVVSRADFIGNDGSSDSNWGGSFLLNVLLAKRR